MIYNMYHCLTGHADEKQSDVSAQHICCDYTSIGRPPCTFLKQCFLPPRDQTATTSKPTQKHKGLYLSIFHERRSQRPNDWVTEHPIRCNILLSCFEMLKHTTHPVKLIKLRSTSPSTGGKRPSQQIKRSNLVCAYWFT